MPTNKSASYLALCATFGKIIVGDVFDLHQKIVDKQSRLIRLILHFLASLILFRLRGSGHGGEQDSYAYLIRLRNSP